MLLRMAFLNTRKWGQGKPPALTWFAQTVAIAAKECVELLEMMRGRKEAQWLREVCPLQDWLKLYRQHGHLQLALLEAFLPPSSDKEPTPTELMELQDQWERLIRMKPEARKAALATISKDAQVEAFAETRRLMSRSRNHDCS